LGDNAQFGVGYLNEVSFEPMSYVAQTAAAELSAAT